MSEVCNQISIHEAFKRGDLDAVRRLLGNPPDFPNCPGPLAVGKIVLQYAIYHSPTQLVCALLELGADPNYADNAGFPSLFAALSTQRLERYEILELLLSFGADVQQRGINDWTPLHYAVAQNDLRMIELLLAHGANPNAKTRIDHYSSPIEDAKKQSFSEAERLLAKLEKRRH